MEIVKEDNLENVSGGLTNHTAAYLLTEKELAVIKMCGYEVKPTGIGAYSVFVLDKKGESINHKVLEGICTAAIPLLKDVRIVTFYDLPDKRPRDHRYIPALRNTDNSSVNLK